MKPMAWVATGLWCITFLVVIYGLLAWIGISFALTGDGPIKWGEGWHQIQKWFNAH